MDITRNFYALRSRRDLNQKKVFKKNSRYLLPNKATSEFHQGKGSHIHYQFASVVSGIGEAICSIFLQRCLRNDCHEQKRAGCSRTTTKGFSEAVSRKLVVSVYDKFVFSVVRFRKHGRIANGGLIALARQSLLAIRFNQEFSVAVFPFIQVYNVVQPDRQVLPVGVVLNPKRYEVPQKWQVLWIGCCGLCTARCPNLIYHHVSDETETSSAGIQHMFPLMSQ